MKIILFLLIVVFFFQSCQKDIIEPGIYVSEFKTFDHVKYKWLGAYRLAGRDSLILEEDGHFEFHALCSKSSIEGEWSINEDTLHLHGDYTTAIPHFYILENKRLYGISKLGNDVALMRILGKVE